MMIFVSLLTFILVISSGQIKLTAGGSSEEGSSSEENSSSEEDYGTEDEGEFVCDGAIAEVACPGNTLLLKQMASRSPFFMDAVGATCSSLDEVIYEDEGAEYTFFSPDGGFSLNAKCPDKNDLIVSFKVCVTESHIPVISLQCHAIKDPDRIVGKFEASSDASNHMNVNCGDAGDVALQGIEMKDSGDGIITKVVLSCVRLAS